MIIADGKTECNDFEHVATMPPRHVAIIMDGNGRWAKRNSKPRILGHNAGMNAMTEIVRHASDTGVEYLTVYAFSTENWKRDEDEVSGIFGLLVKFVDLKLRELIENNVVVSVIGDYEVIPAAAKVALERTISDTASNTGMRFIIALNYGSRRDIVEAAQHMALKAIDRVIFTVGETTSDFAGRAKSAADSVPCTAGETVVDFAGGMASATDSVPYTDGETAADFAERVKRTILELDEYDFASGLSTADVPDPDIVIRTSGEKRLSNFLLWESAYSELVFTDVLWPDFTPEEFDKCIDEYHARDRRYGGR